MLHIACCLMSLPAIAFIMANKQANGSKFKRGNGSTKPRQQQVRFCVCALHPCSASATLLSRACMPCHHCFVSLPALPCSCVPFKAVRFCNQGVKCWCLLQRAPPLLPYTPPPPHLRITPAGVANIHTRASTPFCHIFSAALALWPTPHHLEPRTSHLYHEPMNTCTSSR